MKSVNKLIKRWIPESPMSERAIYYPKFRNFVEQRADEGRRFGSRIELYRYVQEELVGSNAIDYLEFGVYEGESLVEWALLNKHEDTRIFGFDTFSGLPENWVEGNHTLRNEGDFDTGGRVPSISDPRVTFVKGLFQETLDRFLLDFKSENILVVHNDSDLYSSTLYVLAKLDHLFRHNTVVILDEFNSWMNEFRAVSDYCSAFRKSVNVVGRTRGFEQVAVTFTPVQW